ncbi:MAG TPA: hypothetical protein VGN16_24265 [Acidobacteriaceae bacterium]
MDRHKEHRASARCRVLAFAMLLATPAGFAQKPGTPSAAVPQGSVTAAKPITSQNLQDRPYSAGWPAPDFPSSTRKARQFTVEYVYRYAQSDYTPAAKITPVKRGESKNDTPEHLMIASISAEQSLDYDWWFSLWDSRSQAMITDLAKTQKHDAAWWKAAWQRSVAGKTVTLYSRLELPNDIILEYRMGAPVPATPGLQTIPMPMRREGGKWFLTLELNDSGFVPFLGQDAYNSPLDFVPEPKYSSLPAPVAALKSQGLFFRDQTRGSESATEFVW